jgi:site-specific DNA-methyltransferase (adenine-specific)
MGLSRWETKTNPKIRIKLTIMNIPELLPLNQVLIGDSIEVMDSLPENSIDLIFADPPYNLQLGGELYRPNMSLVSAVDDDWDRFDNFSAYDSFSKRWLTSCRRILNNNGTIWVIGSYHNIYRIGAIMQDVGYWFLNDIVWIKTNPMPNFRGVRFTNAHETLIWACKNKEAHYTFNHHNLKFINDDLQMRSDWLLPICTGEERLKENGKKAHSTQKPEALLYRVILASSRPKDIILDPFFGTGTTGVVAKKLNRQWIGIEKEERYAALAQKRIDSTPQPIFESGDLDFATRRKAERRIPFGSLLENGLLFSGQELYFQKDRNRSARIRPDGLLEIGAFFGSIHRAGSYLSGGVPCNGWEQWFYESDDKTLHPIDDLRCLFRKQTAE